MKKNKTKDQEQNRKSRLSLNRETIRILNDPTLLELAGVGGGTSGTGSQGVTCPQYTGTANC